MKLSRLYIATFLLSAVAFMPCRAQSTAAEPEQTEETDESEEPEDEDERSIRENPVIDGEDYDDEIIIPEFIKLKRNHIDFNGANWNALRNALGNSNRMPVSIVAIGDSHYQADFATGVVRDNLQLDYGNAGRGLVVPLRLSGTNEPHDYSFTSTHNWNSVKLMSQSWPRTMGFTGASITPVNMNSTFMVSTSERDDYNPFSSITVFHNGQFFVTGVTDEDGNALSFVATPSKDYTEIRLTKDVNAARIHFDSAGDLTIFGANLSGQRPGLFFHTIGNNGATYDTYNRIATTGHGISALQPKLIIISLGTNEAFGHFNKQSFKNSIDRLVKDIRSQNPDATLLLVTPMECQRSRVITQRSSSKGRRRRRTVRTSRVYEVNSNVAKVREAIAEYGKDNHIAVYDWYNVAGGSGASAKWINAGLFSRDRVHHSMRGYTLQGELLYQALREAFRPQSK